MTELAEHPTWAVELVHKKDLAGLLNALAGENSGVVREAAWGLAHMGDPRAVEPLMGRLKDGDPEVRKAVVEALGILGDKRAVKGLTELTRDRDPDVRGQVVWALGGLCDPVSVPALLTMLADDELYTDSYGEKEIIGWQAASSLAGLGTASLKPLLSAAAAKNPRVRENVARALGYLEDEKAVPALVKLLWDKNREVRRAALNALGAIRSKKAFRPMLECLKDRNQEIRWSAVLALGQLKDRRGTPALLTLLKRDSDDIRYMVTGALATMGDPRAVQPLIDTLAENSRVSEGAARALGEIGDPVAVPFLARVLEASVGRAPEPPEGKAAAAGAARQRTRGKKHAVTRRADAELLLAVISSLGMLKARSASEALVLALQLPHEEIRVAAAAALGGLGVDHAVKALERSLIDPSAQVRATAAKALEQITGRTYL